MSKKGDRKTVNGTDRERGRGPEIKSKRLPNQSFFGEPTTRLLSEPEAFPSPTPTTTSLDDSQLNGCFEAFQRLMDLTMS